MLELILYVLQTMAAPLSTELILGAVTAGLFFGGIYNHYLKLPESFIYDHLITGLGFIIFLFIFRLGSAIVTGLILPNPLGWAAIGVLWLIFCFFVWLGQRATRKIS